MQRPHRLPAQPAPPRSNLALASKCPHTRAFLFVIMISFFFRSLLTMLALVTNAWAQDYGQPQLELPRVALSAGMHRLDVQVARTPEQRATGLMFRKEMPQHEGMLFIFEQATVQCFWMKNTLLPLTVAFLADDGMIVNLADMKPQTTDSHCSKMPVRFVLEMNQGWFAKKGLKPGQRIQGEPFRTQ